MSEGLVGIREHKPEGIVRLTRPQRAGLMNWLRGPTSIYHTSVRADVGKRLLSMGLIAPESSKFPSEYSICAITAAGRSALEGSGQIRADANTNSEAKP